MAPRRASSSSFGASLSSLTFDVGVEAFAACRQPRHRRRVRFPPDPVAEVYIITKAYDSDDDRGGDNDLYWPPSLEARNRQRRLMRAHRRLRRWLAEEEGAALRRQPAKKRDGGGGGDEKERIRGGRHQRRGGDGSDGGGDSGRGRRHVRAPRPPLRLASEELNDLRRMAPTLTIPMAVGVVYIAWGLLASQ